MPHSAEPADAPRREGAPPRSTSVGPGERLRGWLATLLLLAAFLAPTLGAWWAREAYPFVDETQVVATALAIELRAPFPPEANWPPHSYHLLRAEWFAGRSFGLLPSLQDLFAELRVGWYAGPTALLGSARALTWILALATIWLCHRLARRVLDPVPAAAAALLFAASPLALQYARYMVTEMPHALWTTAALWLALRLLEEKRAGIGFAAGAATGLAVASKYLGGLAGLAVAFAWAVPSRSGNAARWGGATGALRGAAAIAAGLGVGLLVGMPDLLANHEAYLAWLRTHFEARDWVWFGFEDAAPPRRFHSLTSLPHVAGSVFALLAALAGAVTLAARRPRAAAALLLFALAFFAVASSNAIRYTRYFLVLAPVLAIGIAALAQELAARVRSPFGPLVAGALVLACVVPSLWAGLEQARAVGRGDTRFDAAQRLAGEGSIGGGLVTLRARRGAGELGFLHNPEYPALSERALELNLASTLRPDALVIWDEFLGRYAAARGAETVTALLPRLQALGLQRAPGDLPGWTLPNAEALYDALLALGLDRYLWSGFVDGVFDDLASTTYPEVRRFLALIERNEVLWKLDPGGELRSDLPRVELVTQGSAHRGASIGGPELRLYALRPRS
ncbi:MAG: glycosyltransferase family 39 protein [Planctomycetes bacterium]|nr:glycosyltransferase family 39 protein [Planctomycetota bacterium]